jgi:hypothetical protein
MVGTDNQSKTEQELRADLGHKLLLVLQCHVESMPRSAASRKILGRPITPSFGGAKQTSALVVAHEEILNSFTRDCSAFYAGHETR